MVAIVLFGRLQLLWAVDDAAVISYVSAFFHACCIIFLFIVRPPGMSIPGLWELHEVMPYNIWIRCTYMQNRNKCARFFYKSLEIHDIHPGFHI